MNFKKCSSLFLALLLLVSNIGLAFNVHYCYGKIAAVSSVFNTEEVCSSMEEEKDTQSCCAKEIAENHKKCCEDKLVNLQDKTDDGVVKTFSFHFEMPFAFQTWKPIFLRTVEVPLKVNTSISYYCEAHSPPLFKLYSQYVFYA